MCNRLCKFRPFTPALPSRDEQEDSGPFNERLPAFPGYATVGEEFVLVHYYHGLLGLVEERAERLGPPILEVAVPLESAL